MHAPRPFTPRFLMKHPRVHVASLRRLNETEGLRHTGKGGRKGRDSDGGCEMRGHDHRTALWVPSYWGTLIPHEAPLLYVTSHSYLFRRKDLKNPRKKHRIKYADAQVRLDEQATE